MWSTFVKWVCHQCDFLWIRGAVLSAGFNRHFLPRLPWQYFRNPLKPFTETLNTSQNHWLRLLTSLRRKNFMFFLSSVHLDQGTRFFRVVGIFPWVLAFQAFFRSNQKNSRTKNSKLKEKTQNSSKKLKVSPNPLGLLAENRSKKSLYYDNL